TAKEMVAAILALGAPVLKTRGNLNNDLGVPLTLLNLGPEHRYAVIEMGANHPGEIAYVAEIAKPLVALITNAGDAHLEGFGSREGVARAKGEMITALPADGVAVLNADDAFIGLWRDLAGARKVLSFGFSEGADVRGLADSVKVACTADGFATRFEYVYKGSRRPIILALPGRHNVANALAAAAACLALGVNADQIAEGLARVSAVPGRMQPEFAGNGALFINDTYNANPSSFNAALDVLLQLPGEPWVVLGAFGELGDASRGLHAELGRESRRRGVTRLLATGPNAEEAVAAFGPGGVHFPEQAELIRSLRETLKPNAVVLVKGSRVQRMERVIEALCRSARETQCC
ncbi:MAG: UDP-N-acetylmuramoyl-tripeptide--D-alanyl-D-alanine ligase, partial [Proteobacteria bacterium]|nr:UDP-N-acetylmuramoyl-tripeptide--D-alanyl-D-alanine ligase [Pseudomonadota bacterium]